MPKYTHARIPGEPPEPPEVLADLPGVLAKFLPQLRSFSWHLAHRGIDQLDVFPQLLECLDEVEYLETGALAFTDEDFEQLPKLVRLRNLRLVRPAATPANDSDPVYWSFDALAEQTAALLDSDERDGEPLRIDVQVEGTLAKYDIAQRSARRAFEHAMRGLPTAVFVLEVRLLFYAKPYIAFP